MTTFSLNHKLAAVCAFIIAGFGTAHTSRGLMAIWDGEVNLTNLLQATYDSRIAARQGAQSDTVFTLRSVLTYNRPSRNLRFGADLGILVKRYLDASEFDDESLYFGFSVTPTTRFETSRFSFSAGLDFDTNSSADPDVGEIVTTRNYGARASLQYRPNERYTIVWSGSARRNDPDSGAFSTIDRLTTTLQIAIPVNVNPKKFKPILRGVFQYFYFIFAFILH